MLQGVSGARPKLFRRRTSCARAGERATAGAISAPVCAISPISAAGSGYRRLFTLLRREGEPSGINRIYRLYREEGLTDRKRRARRQAVGTRTPILVEAKVNARWSLDFVHDQFALGQRYSTAGARAGTEFRVNTTIAGNQLLPSVAGLKDGGFVVAWETSPQDGSGLGVYDQRYGKTGVKAAPVQFLVNTTTAGNQYQPRVAGFSDTGFVAAWTSQGQDGSGLGVYGQIFSATGAKLNVEFRVNTTVLHDQWQPAVATLAGPNFVVAWTSPDVGSSLGVYAQRLSLSR